MTIPKLPYISQGNSPKEHLENIQKSCTFAAEIVKLCLNDVSEKKVSNMQFSRKFTFINL